MPESRWVSTSRLTRATRRGLRPAVFRPPASRPRLGVAGLDYGCGTILPPGAGPSLSSWPNFKADVAWQEAGVSRLRVRTAHGGCRHHSMAQRYLARSPNLQVELELPFSHISSIARSLSVHWLPVAHRPSSGPSPSGTALTSDLAVVQDSESRRARARARHHGACCTGSRLRVWYACDRVLRARTEVAERHNGGGLPLGHAVPKFACTVHMAV
jgi:hypothetical protein